MFITNSKEKANGFNNFFLSHSDIDLSNARLPSFDHDVRGNILDKIVITETEVNIVICILNVNKSTGHDGVSLKMLKLAGLAIIPSLTRLFNKCLCNNKFPNEWKMANVIPLHKKDSKDKCTNYRPVSILPIIGKIFEKIIFKNVYNFFHDNQSLTCHQSGFRPNDSTINQLAYLYHTFSQALDRKKDIRIVFCDISKAFDRVWHDGLIYKLREIGITGNLLALFTDYLHNRQQRVVIKGQFSSWGHIKAGVPQGSVLGPLLFLVYINDLTKMITCDVKLFADDTVLYTLVDNQVTSANLLNFNLQQVKRWADDWLVSFNTEKTKLMNISFKRNINFEMHPVIFDDKPLQSVTTHKHLGLILSDNLKWTTHIDSIIQSVAKFADVMTKLKYKLDRKTLENIYISYVRPKLEYASVIWDDCSEHCATKLENIQLLFGRIITGAKRGTSHKLLYKELSWRTLSERRTIAKFKFVHKLYHNTAPDYLLQLLPVPSGTNVSYGLRYGNNIRQFPVRTEQFKKSLLPDCIRKWNQLSLPLRNIINLKLFMNSMFVPPLHNPLFYGCNRRLSVIHAQLRMKCSNLNSDLFGLHVADSSNCICSNSVENCEHFFFKCTLFTVERVDLFRKIRDIYKGDITSNLLLYGDENQSVVCNQQIFRLVETFIQVSGRFPV